jgi:hypothetical protein
MNASKLTFKLMLSCLVVIATYQFTHAQILDPEIYPQGETKLRKNSIYGELLGSGFLFSINYEREIHRKDNLQVNFRVGFGSAIFINAVPLTGLNVLVGRKQNFFELGFNGIRTYAVDFFGGSGNYVLGNPVIGYRFQGYKGIIFRASFTPFFQLYDPEDWISDQTFVPFLGLSLGYKF